VEVIARLEIVSIFFQFV